jgi:hypothetical protein
MAGVHVNFNSGAFERAVEKAANDGIRDLASRYMKSRLRFYLDGGRLEATSPIQS